VEKATVLNRLSGAVRRSEIVGDAELEKKARRLIEEVRSRKSWEGAIPRVEDLLSALWKSEAGITDVDPIKQAFDKANSKLKKHRRQQNQIPDSVEIVREALGGRDPEFFAVTRRATRAKVLDPGKYARRFRKVRGEWVQG